MIKVVFLANVVGAVYDRMSTSMIKYKPDDIDIVDIHGRYAIPLLDKPDIVVGHLGVGSYCPHWAYISPKIVMIEETDDVTLSYFTDKDIVVTYRPDRVDYIKSKGLNVLLWAVPVDPEIFYCEDLERNKYNIVTSGHNNWAEKVGCITNKAIALGVGKDDYCWVGRDDDRLRNYYNVSKYASSFLTQYEYYPKMFNAGFEVGNVEAAFCGCTPLVLDQADYLKYWFGDFAKFVSPDDFENHLKEILESEYEPLSKDVIRSVVSRFNAKDMWEEFWNKVQEVIQ